MPSLWYLERVIDVARLGTVFTLVTNSFLIYVTVAHIKNVTTAYKALIILLAAIGIVFSIMENFVHAFFHSYNASFMYFSVNSMFGASKRLKTWMILVYSQLYVLIICLIALQFVYRLWVMTCPEKVKYFHGFKTFWWFLYLLTACIVWALSVGQCLPDEYSMEYLRSEIRDEYGSDVTEIASYFIVAYHKSSDGARSIRWNSVVCILGLSSVLVTQYIVILYCIVKIRDKLRFMLDMTSSKQHQLQSQLFKTLVFQISAPSLFYHIPVFFMYIVPYLDIEMSVPSGIMICFFSVYPALDSVILMCMVTEYRKAVKNWLAKAVNRAVDPQTPTASSALALFKRRS